MYSNHCLIKPHQTLVQYKENYFSAVCFREESLWPSITLNYTEGKSGQAGFSSLQPGSSSPLWKASFFLQQDLTLPALKSQLKILLTSWVQNTAPLCLQGQGLALCVSLLHQQFFTLSLVFFLVQKVDFPPPHIVLNVVSMHPSS